MTAFISGVFNFTFWISAEQPTIEGVDFGIQTVLIPFISLVTAAVLLLCFTEKLSNLVMGSREVNALAPISTDNLLSIGIRLICLYKIFDAACHLTNDAVSWLNLWLDFYVSEWDQSIAAGYFLQIILAVVIWFVSPRIVCFTNRVTGEMLPDKSEQPSE